jgi:hypothetical protein
MENIVFIADYYFYKNSIGKTNYYFINNIKNNNDKYNIHIFYTDDDINKINEDILKIKPKLIIFFECNSFQQQTTKFSFVFQLKIPVFIFLDDSYYISSITSKCPYINNSNGLIFWYKNNIIINSYKKVFPYKYILNLDSRYVNTDIYKDYKLEKKYDILIYGTRNFSYDYKNEKLDTIQNYIKKYEEYYDTIINSKISFYPLRSKIENILLQNNHKYNLKILEEKTIDLPNTANEELSMLINQSYLTLSCPSIADVLLHKHLEITASNSVILGSYPSDYKELFEGNVIEINEFMSNEEILNIIDNALANKDKLLEMSKRIYNKVHEKHNLNKAQESFNKTIDNILGNKNKLLNEEQELKMVKFFFYNKFTNIEVIKKITTNFQIFDGYIIIQNYDPENDILEISNNSINNNKLLYGKIVNFYMKFDDIIKKISEIEECKINNKIKYTVKTMWVNKQFGGTYKAYIIL